VGASNHSPFGDAERTASRPLPVLRLIHLVGLLSFTALALSLITMGWELEHAAWILIRNLLGLAGLAFLTARVLGGRLSWLVPLVFVALIPLIGEGASAGEWTWWAWPAQPGADPLSALLAFSLLASGLLCACLLGAREQRGEAD
jgi:hypothetical protein